jgi:hypothetical protein
MPNFLHPIQLPLAVKSPFPRPWSLRRIFCSWTNTAARTSLSSTASGLPRCSRRFRGLVTAGKNTWLSLHRSPRRPGSPRATFSSQKALSSLRSFRPASPPGCPNPGPAYFQTEQQLNQLVWQYPLTDFTLPPPGLGGNVLVTSESGILGADTSLVTFNGTNYVQTSFGPRPPGLNEGSAFVDCDVPTPTPTPTATATATPTPSGVCPLTQGYWKNHPNAWPVDSLMLGSQTYNMTELLAILGTPSGGDASIILAKQLIAAKLNIANGSDPTPISSTITHADSLLSMFSGKLPYHVSPSSMIGQQMVNDGKTLDNYNNGRLTPGCSGS